MNTMNIMNSMNNMNIKAGINLKTLATGLFIVFSLISPSTYAKHLHYEKEYQEYFCNLYGGTMEVQLRDYTRVDCETENNAIEFDFAKKWAESVGQSLYYSLRTGKKAGIVLIMENPVKDKYYLMRVLDLAKEHNIDVWTMTDLTEEAIRKEN